MALARSVGGRWWGVAIVLLGLGSAAGAGDEPPKTSPAPLELRFFDVSALTQGVPSFEGERGPFPVRCDQVNDQTHPLFGGEAEEEVRPYGSAEDVVELIKSGVGEAGDWETEGCSIAAAGQQFIVIRHRRKVLDAVAPFLEGLTRAILDTVTVDVAAFRVAAMPFDGEGGVPAAVGRGALVPLAAARATGTVGQVVVGRSGGQQAYLEDQDVEVAQDARGPDPIVGLVYDGIAFRVRPQVATKERVRLEMEAWFARPGPIRSDRAVGADPVETLDLEGRSLNVVWEGRPGVWGLLPATGDVVFAVRASVRRADQPAVAPPSAGVFPAFPPRGPVLLRDFDVRDLGTRIQHERGPAVRLLPSNFTPPEPPELPEPDSAFPVYQLVERVKGLVDPTSWASEGTSIELKAGHLIVRHDAAHLAAVEAMLGVMKTASRRAWRVRLDVVAVPVLSLPEWWSGLDDGADLLAAGPAALLSRPGARRLDGTELRLLGGQRGASAGGSEHHYVGDYDVEIAEKSMIGNPVEKSALEGLVLDVQAVPALGGALLWCEVRLDRSTWRGSRSVATRWGAIECPSLGTERDRGMVALPLTGARIVAGSLQGGGVVLFVLSAKED